VVPPPLHLPPAAPHELLRLQRMQRQEAAFGQQEAVFGQQEADAPWTPMTSPQHPGFFGPPQIPIEPFHEGARTVKCISAPESSSTLDNLWAVHHLHAFTAGCFKQCLPRSGV